MSVFGRLSSLFPIAHSAGIVGSAVNFVLQPSWVSGSLLITVIYLAPLLIFRVHQQLKPLSEGTFDLQSPVYSPWWGSYNIQLLFNAFPGFERILLLVPGLYSLWLRAWGSQIGRRNFYAVNLEVYDRSLLLLGDDIVVGAHTVFCAHAITPAQGTQLLIVKKIRVGTGAFIGAESRLGPGAVIEANGFLPRGSIELAITRSKVRSDQ